MFALSLTQHGNGRLKVRKMERPLSKISDAVSLWGQSQSLLPGRYRSCYASTVYLQPGIKPRCSEQALAGKPPFNRSGLWKNQYVVRAGLTFR